MDKFFQVWSNCLVPEEFTSYSMHLSLAFEYQMSDSAATPLPILVSGKVFSTFAQSHDSRSASARLYHL